MRDSAKKSPSSPKDEQASRADRVRSARKHFREGGKAAEYAREHGLSRTTVIGWCNGKHAGSRGRRRTLDASDETEILNSLFASQSGQTWKTVLDRFRKQSVKVEKRKICRFLTKLGLNAEPTKAGEPMRISASQWIQPSETMETGYALLRGTIWRLLSGRGVEGFHADGKRLRRGG